MRCEACGCKGRPAVTGKSLCKTCLVEEAQKERFAAKEKVAVARLKQQTQDYLHPIATEKVVTPKSGSISVKGTTHQRFSEYATARGQSMSSVLDEMITEKLDAAGAPHQPYVKQPRSRKADERILDQYLVF
jgi:hypothetical protein